MLYVHEIRPVTQTHHSGFRRQRRKSSVLIHAYIGFQRSHLHDRCRLGIDPVDMYCLLEFLSVFIYAFCDHSGIILRGAFRIFDVKG